MQKLFCFARNAVACVDIRRGRSIRVSDNGKITINTMPTKKPKQPFIAHESPCMGAKCRQKAVHLTLKGLGLCPACFARVRDKDFKVKR